MVHEYEAEKVNRVGSGGSFLIERTGDNVLLPPGSTGLSTSAHMVRLQRQYGNRYVQRVMAVAKVGEYPSPVIRRDDNDDQQKPAPLVGQDRAIDPKDRSLSLQWPWDFGKKQQLTPSGVSVDPGIGHGGPATYPAETPEAPSGTVDGIDRPANCPADRWEPPSPKNWYHGQCRNPGASPASPSPSPGPQTPGPGDYNVPDESNTAMAKRADGNQPR